jgi:iron complex transport system substrate-binding protein
MIMAKAVYPDRFSDVDLELWIREYIVELYGTEENTTDQVVDAMMLEYLEIV